MFRFRLSLCVASLLIMVPVFSMTFKEQFKNLFSRSSQPHVHDPVTCNKPFKTLLQQGKFDCLLYNLETHDYSADVLNAPLYKDKGTLLDFIIIRYGNNVDPFKNVPWPKLLHALLRQKNVQLSHQGIIINVSDRSVKSLTATSLFILFNKSRYDQKISFVDEYKEKLELGLEVMQILQAYGVNLNHGLFQNVVFKQNPTFDHKIRLLDCLLHEYNPNNIRFNEVERVFQNMMEIFLFMGREKFCSIMPPYHELDMLDVPDFLKPCVIAFVQKITRLQRQLRSFKGFEDVACAFE